MSREQEVDENLNQEGLIELISMKPEENNVIQKIRNIFAEVILPFLRATATDETDDFYIPVAPVKSDQSQSTSTVAPLDSAIALPVYSETTIPTSHPENISNKAEEFDTLFVTSSFEWDETIQLPDSNLMTMSPKSGIFESKRLDTPRGRQIGAVRCRYSISGCKEMVIPGSVSEKEHSKCCDFRPIECFLDECRADIPYHSFLIHLNQHFIYPTYDSKLTTSAIVHTEDFSSDGLWSPKWLSTQGHHFFLMLMRNESGYWASWIWVFGTNSEAQTFSSRITFFKGMKCITGTYPVYSIRRMPHEILESGKGCLLTSDADIKKITNIGRNFVTDLAIHVHVYSSEENVIGSKGITSCQVTDGISESQESQVSSNSMNSTIMLKVSNFVQSFSTKLT